MGWFLVVMRRAMPWAAGYTQCSFWQLQCHWAPVVRRVYAIRWFTLIARQSYVLRCNQIGTIAAPGRPRNWHRVLFVQLQHGATTFPVAAAVSSMKNNNHVNRGNYEKHLDFLHRVFARRGMFHR